MAQRSIYVCDVCEAEQQTTNHWFAIIITDRGGDNVLTLAVLGSIAAQQPADRLFHLCGEACVAKKISEFLSRRAAPVNDATNQQIQRRNE